VSRRAVQRWCIILERRQYAAASKTPHAALNLAGARAQNTVKVASPSEEATPLRRRPQPPQGHSIIYASARFGRDYLRAPELNGAVPIVGPLGAGVLGPVLLQVGTAFVVPTDDQVYDPTDGAVTVPT
jgi:hypothetical protein